MINEFDKDIKSDVGSTPREIVDKIMDKFLTDNSLDDKYIGIVEDNNDPEKLGRCKIRVYGVFDPIPVADLPWAVQDASFVGSTKGSFIIPTKGTIVSVYFDRGEIYLPRYTTKVLNKQQLPKRKDVDYPDNMVFFETENGDSFELNRKQKTATYYHSSGTKLHIDGTGSVTVNGVEDVNIQHVKNLFVDGSTVTPEGVGPLCAIPSCLFAGAPHTGRTALPHPEAAVLAQE